jgi:uncharacterized protein YqgV (UPF0045/DUF77 family)
MIVITAQVSLYPLRQESLAPVIDETLQVFRKAALEVEPDTMSTLLVGDEITIFSALQQAFHHAAEQSQVVMVVTFSNACPVPEKKDKSTRKTSEKREDPSIT